MVKKKRSDREKKVSEIFQCCNTTQKIPKLLTTKYTWHCNKLP